MPSSFQSILMLVFFVDMAIMLGVGGRLLYAAYRNRRTPEAAIGASAAFGALAVILSLVTTQVLGREPDAFPVWVASRICHAIGASSLAIGSWRIYRPEQTWAAALAAGISALAAVSCAMRTMTGAMPAPLDNSIGPLLSSATSLAAYGWAAIEAFRYHALLRRRLALGLADPVVTHQFLLWGVSAGSAFGSSAVSLFFTHVLGLSIAATVVPFVAIQLALFTAAVCLWFAFFPPGFYRRRLLRVAAD